MKFIDGERYDNGLKRFMVMAVDHEDGYSALLAIMWVDRDTNFSIDPDELEILKEDYKKWELVE